MRLIFLLGILFFGLYARGQSLTGTNGLFKIPSAYILNDGNIYAGLSFYPKGSYGSFGELYSKNENSGMPTFITLSLYNRVEFMFRYTHVLGIPVNPSTRYFPDRMFTLRYNILQENLKRPAVSIGFHDVSEALGATSAAPYFLSSYLVSTKTFGINKTNLSLTFGYAYDLLGISRPMIFDGLFGGLELYSSSLPSVVGVMEYDSSNLNVALKLGLFDHFHFGIGLLDMKAFSGFFTYRFNLSNR